MIEILNRLAFYFQFPFVRYAMIVGILIALCSSLLGVTLVLKRFSFIGHGLSNVAFGTIAIATALNMTNHSFLVLPVTILSSILLLRTGKSTKINGDAAIAMISVGALGLGYLVLNLFPNSANLAGDICTTLFGSTSILTLSMSDVWLSVALSVFVVAVFLLFYHQIFSVTFDEDFAEATGVKAKTYNLILAVIIAVVIVLAINLVGTLLISALIIFPALTAMRVFKSFLSVTICSVVISVACAVSGILISILAETPVGSTIVATQIEAFIVFCIIGILIRRFAKRKI
jgi:zinc transport system permease protein